MCAGAEHTVKADGDGSDRLGAGGAHGSDDTNYHQPGKVTLVLAGNWLRL